MKPRNRPFSQAFTKAPRIPARKSAAVPLRVVPCPDCAAGVGEPCTTATGKVNTVGHRSRQRLARRARNTPEGDGS